MHRARSVPSNRRRHSRWRTHVRSSSDKRWSSRDTVRLVTGPRPIAPGCGSRSIEAAARRDAAFDCPQRRPKRTGPRSSGDAERGERCSRPYAKTSGPPATRRGRPRRLPCSVARAGGASCHPSTRSRPKRGEHTRWWCRRRRARRRSEARRLLGIGMCVRVGECRDRSGGRAVRDRCLPQQRTSPFAPRAQPWWPARTEPVARASVRSVTAPITNAGIGLIGIARA